MPVPGSRIGDFMLETTSRALLVLASAAVALAQAPAFKRTVLQTVDLSITDRQAVTAKAEFPGGASSGRHTHPGEEVGYLLEGSVAVEIDGVSTTLTPGHTFARPASE